MFYGINTPRDAMFSSTVTSLVYLVMAAILLPVTPVDGAAVLQLQMLQFDNSAGKDWDGSSCDWLTSCDHIFTFNLDLSSGLALHSAA